MVKPGIHPGLGMEEYHGWQLDRAKIKDGPISLSFLKRFGKDPYRWRYSPEPATTTSMRKGSLWDMCLTEPETVRDRVVVSPFDSFKTKAAREWRDLEQSKGKLVVSEADLEEGQSAAARVRQHQVAGPIVEHSQTQVGVVGEINGTPAKCLIDLAPDEDHWEEELWDYKTTSDGLSDDAIRHTLYKFDYYAQAAFYRSLWNSVSPDRHCEVFGFIFQDTLTQEVRVLRLGSDSLGKGTAAVKKWLDAFRICCREGFVSRYRSQVDTLEISDYGAAKVAEMLEG